MRQITNFKCNLGFQIAEIETRKNSEKPEDVKLKHSLSDSPSIPTPVLGFPVKVNLTVIRMSEQE